MRPSRHQMFLAMARAAATRATCYRLNVGAVVVSDRNVVGIGYNGAPRGMGHCTGNGCQYFTPSGCKVIHAEVNALERASESFATEVDLYVTHSPCAACAGLILSTRNGVSQYPRVRSVYFETAYRDPTPLQSLGGNVYQVLPSGLLVDFVTGELLDA